MEQEALGSFYTIQEVAKILRVSKGTAWRWIRDQKLPAYKVGDRAIRIRKEDLPLVIKRTDVNVKGMEKVIVPDKEHQLATLEEARRLQAEMENRLGKPLPSSAEEIRALREKRAGI
jgi:excisionase family DNA binding protein